MITRKYEFNKVYYSNLDNPTNEIKKFSEYLQEDNKDNYNTYYISLVHKEEKIIDINCEYNNELKEYIFIESELAGLGIQYFILLSDNPNICNLIKKHLVNMSLYEYYGDEWIELLLNHEVKKIYKTDCDGGFNISYELDK